MTRGGRGKMAEFDREGYIRFALQHGVIGFSNDEIKLKSGRLSRWYANWRTPAEDVCLTEVLSDYVISFAKSLGHEPNLFLGVPEGATKLAIITQYKWAKESETYSPGSHPLSMGRGKSKEHGAPKDRFFVGEPKGNAVLLEDVTTTGGSLLGYIDCVKGAGANILAAYGLMTRQALRDDRKTVEEACREKGVNYYAMCTAQDLLPRAYKQYICDLARSVEEEFQKYGAVPLKLA
jgi:orotate phosphoribosyltransferase